MTMNDALADAMRDAGYQLAPPRQPRHRIIEKAVDTASELTRENQRLRWKIAALEAQLVELQGRAAANTLGGLARNLARKRGIKVSELKAERKFDRIVKVRDAFCWHAYRGLGASLQEIGNFLGKHHTTVIAAVRRHQARLDAGEAS